MKVLIVDDYKTNLRSVRNVLKQINITEVDEATNGSTALQLLREMGHNLIICDEKLDPMSGLDLLKEIRADGRLGHTPFIIMFAANNPDKLQAAIQAAKDAGVSNYIIKPFEPKTLKQRIEDAIGGPI